MKKNLAVLLLLLAGVAVSTRPGPRTEPQSDEHSAGEALCRDERRCLAALWGTPPQVELIPTGGGWLMSGGPTPQVRKLPETKGLELEITQSFPSGTSSTRKRWCYQLAEMVARRHPRPRPTDLRVVGVSRYDEDLDEGVQANLLRWQRQSKADQLAPGSLILLDVQFAHSGKRAPGNIDLKVVSTFCCLVTPDAPSPLLLQSLKPDRVLRLPPCPRAD